MDEAVLIDMIQHYPHLFDKSKADYKNNEVKENSWRAISLAMSESVEECQRVWRNLRERYARERKIITSRPSGSASVEYEWPLYKNMHFMAKHIATQKRISNVKAPRSLVMTDPDSRSPLLSPVTSLCSSPVSSTSSQRNSPWSSLSTIIHEHDDSDTEDHEGGITQDIEKEAVTAVEESQQPTPKRRRVTLPDPQPIKETLSALTTYFKGRKSDSNVAFGNYVAAAMAEMPTRERNEKKIKIMQILAEEFVDE